MICLDDIRSIEHPITKSDVAKIATDIGAFSYAIVVDSFQPEHIPDGYFEAQDVYFGMSDDEHPWWLDERLSHGGIVITAEYADRFIG